MTHTCTQGNQGDSQLLMVESQIGNLTSGPFLAITYVLSAELSHVSPFKTSRLQERSNDINNSSIQCVLTPAIAF
jgi:hypothetical protein